jgi:hypothetical protein
MVRAGTQPVLIERAAYAVFYVTCVLIDFYLAVLCLLILGPLAIFEYIRSRQR